MLPRALHPTMAKLRKLFDEGAELTAHDAEARLFVDVRNAREYLKLLKAEGYIYIARWRRDTMHGRWTPVYALKRDGDDRDAETPKRVSAVEAATRYRARGDNWEKELQRQRVARRRKQFLAEGIQLDPLMAAVNRDATMAV